MRRRPLSRRESQERTRAALLDSGARAFARHGVERASIQQVARGAGFTRGAFYAHFRNKEELCMAILEDRFDTYIAEFDQILATGEEPEVRARRAGDHLTSLLTADPEWQRLMLEFSVYGLRNDRFRRRLVERYAALRERVADVFRSRAKESGVTAPIPYERLALMTYSIASGVGMTKLLEPDVVPESLHGEMLAILFAGLRAAGEGSSGENR
jgi:AcrR family transcriptional regulator